MEQSWGEVISQVIEDMRIRYLAIVEYVGEESLKHQIELTESWRVRGLTRLNRHHRRRLRRLALDAVTVADYEKLAGEVLCDV